jgi:hypothetical protein
MQPTEILAGLRRGQERRGVLPTSIEAREAVVRRFMAYVAPKPVFDATRTDVEEWLDSRNLSSGTRRGYLSHLHKTLWSGLEGVA